MRKKLKIAASILCLTLAGSVLAGCGKEEKTVSTEMCIRDRYRRQKCPILLLRCMLSLK